MAAVKRISMLFAFARRICQVVHPNTCAPANLCSIARPLKRRQVDSSMGMVYHFAVAALYERRLFLVFPGSAVIDRRYSLENNTLPVDDNAFGNVNSAAT
jgi:hypothetical protein